MKLPFSLFLAARYLKPKRSFLTVISLISVTGVILGIMALVVVTAVMTGFDKEIRRKILGHEPHLTISHEGGLLENWEAVQEKLDRIEGIEATAPHVMGPVLLDVHGQHVAPEMLGVDAEAEEKLLGVRRFIKEGTYDLDGDKCVMGADLAARMGVIVGDIVKLKGANIQELMTELEKAEKKDPNAKTLTDIRSLARPLDLEVTGLFQTGHYNYDSNTLLIPLHLAQTLYGLEGKIHGIAVRTKDAFLVENFKPVLRAQLGDEFTITSWIDQNRQFFSAIENERSMLFFIVALVVVVAGFSITNTLITLTVLKRREIGVLKALGASTGGVVRVFVAQGVVVGIVGTLLGFGLAALVIYFRNDIHHGLASAMGIEIFPKQIYQLDGIPAQILPGDMLLIGSLSFVICVLAAVVPAWLASRLDPVTALREQ